MNGPLQFETAEPSSEVLAALYETSQEFSSCHILVPLPDDAVKHPMTLFLRTKKEDETHDYQIMGGDRAYRTQAKLSPSGDAFDVDVVIRYHNHTTRPATVFVSQEIESIIKEHRY